MQTALVNCLLAQHNHCRIRIDRLKSKSCLCDAETMSRISIAMCTYNGARFLQEQLASIAAQQRLPDEMVVCDDGSTDTTLEILEKFSQTVSFPVRIVRNPVNLGSTKNFEQAMRLCTGDLIALSDQDDVWLPHKLAVQEAVFVENADVGGGFTDAELIDASSSPIGAELWSSILFTAKDQALFQRGGAVRVLLQRNVVTGATLMFRASLLDEFLPIPECWVHDGWIAWMLILFSRIMPIEQPTMRYRLHDMQQTGVKQIALESELSLRERLARGNQDESVKYTGRAGELKVLLNFLRGREEPQCKAILSNVSRAVQFFEHRAAYQEPTDRRILAVLLNAMNYCRYEHGIRVMMRDFVSAFIKAVN